MTELMLLGALAVLCTLGQLQSHNVDASASAQLGPLGPNPLAALQADPNFLRFGRSAPATALFGEFGQDEAEKRAAGAQSANFLRFGKSGPSEPNFLRFGRRIQQAAAKRLLSSQQQQQKAATAVDPSFLRFGRAGGKANNFLRFGRAPEAELVEMEEAFERELRQPNPNFLRFG